MDAIDPFRQVCGQFAFGIHIIQAGKRQIVPLLILIIPPRGARRALTSCLANVAVEDVCSRFIP